MYLHSIDADKQHKIIRRLHVLEKIIRRLHVLEIFGTDLLILFMLFTCQTYLM